MWITAALTHPNTVHPMPGSHGRRRGSLHRIPSLQFDTGLSLVEGATPAVETMQMGPQASVVELPTVSEITRLSHAQAIAQMSAGAYAIASEAPSQWETTVHVASVYGVGADNPVDPSDLADLQARTSACPPHTLPHLRSLPPTILPRSSSHAHSLDPTHRLCPDPPSHYTPHCRCVDPSSRCLSIPLCSRCDMPYTAVAQRVGTSSLVDVRPPLHSNACDTFERLRVSSHRSR